MIFRNEFFRRREAVGIGISRKICNFAGQSVDKPARRASSNIDREVDAGAAGGNIAVNAGRRASWHIHVVTLYYRNF